MKAIGKATEGLTINIKFLNVTSNTTTEGVSFSKIIAKH